MIKNQYDNQTMAQKYEVQHCIYFIQENYYQYINYVKFCIIINKNYLLIIDISQELQNIFNINWLKNKKNKLLKQI